MKKLIVFGATGRTGLAILERSRKDPDLQVTAFVRKAYKVPKEVENHITIILGDVCNEVQVASAIEGQDAVISCLGIGFNLRSTTVISEGVRNIVCGMREHGLKRIALVGVSFLMPGHATPLPLKAVAADHQRAFCYLKNCKDIEWIVSAPPEITDLPYTGTYKTCINKLAGSYVVTTHDLADWLIGCIKDDEKAREYCHQLVGIASFLGTYVWLTGTKFGGTVLLTVIILLGSLYLWCLF